MEKLFSETGRESELDSFLESFTKTPVRGIRMNGLKIESRTEFRDILEKMYRDFEMLPSFRKVLWSDDGYYINENFMPGKHPFYNAGLFYLQEPSAMLPAYALEACPKERILDICAAPGGKTVKIAADMEGEGVLVANDISGKRTKALVKNIELAGCTNVIVLNESPENLVENFCGYFDKILVDAPCSGEGMYRRDPGSMKNIQTYSSQSYSCIQKEILDNACKLLRPSGVMVYSTCTFSYEENEGVIETFLQEHPEFYTVDIKTSEYLIEKAGAIRGVSGKFSTQKALRIMPHKASGEGHFCIKLQKEENCKKEIIFPKKAYAGKKDKKNSRGEYSQNDFRESFRDFSKGIFTSEYSDGFFDKVGNNIRIINCHVYVFEEEFPDLSGLKAPKLGFYLGKLRKTSKKALFEPSHSFALSLKNKDLVRYLNFRTTEIALEKYLKGETLTCEHISSGNKIGDCHSPGFVPVAVEGYILGWSKSETGGKFKNLYPPGWVKDRHIYYGG